MRTLLRSSWAALPVASILLLGACSGGGSDGGVATLASEGASAAAGADTAASDAPTEEEILDWVECMRNEGLDIADPTVNEDGNLVLGGGPRGGLGGPRPAAGSTATTVAGAAAQPPDREAFQGAVETCGQPPRAAGNFSGEDRQAFQDAALELAQCMRDEGLDVPDPDFSGAGPGGPPAGAAPADGGGATQVRRGPFGDLDMSDPVVQAAFDTCRDKLGDAFPAGPGGGPAGRAAPAATDGED